MSRRKFSCTEAMYTYDVAREDGQAFSVCSVLFSVVVHPDYLVKVSINGEQLDTQRFCGIPDHVQAFLIARKAYEDLPHDLQNI